MHRERVRDYRLSNNIIIGTMYIVSCICVRTCITYPPSLACTLNSELGTSRSTSTSKAYVHLPSVADTMGGRSRLSSFMGMNTFISSLEDFGWRGEKKSTIIRSVYYEDVLCTHTM